MHHRARAAQRPPAGDWRTWLLAGRPGRRQDPHRRRAGPPLGRVGPGPPHRPRRSHGRRLPRYHDPGAQRHPVHRAALEPAPVRALQAPADLAQRRHRDLPVGRPARAGPRTPVRPPLVRRALCLAVPAADVGDRPAVPPPGTAAPDGRHHHPQADQAPGADPRRARRPGSRRRPRSPTPGTWPPSSSPRSPPCTRARGWAGRSSRPRSSTPRRPSASRRSPRRGTSWSGPSTSRACPSGWPSTAACRGTSAPCSSRSASATARARAASDASSRVFADYYAVDQTCHRQRRGHRAAGAPGLRRPASISVYLDPASTARSGVGPAARGEFARVLGERITTTWPSHRVLEGLDQVEILLGAAPREPDLLDPPPLRVPHRELPDLPAGRAAGRGPRHPGRPPAPGRGGHRRACGGPSAPSSPRAGSSRPVPHHAGIRAGMINRSGPARPSSARRRSRPSGRSAGRRAERGIDGGSKDGATIGHFRTALTDPGCNPRPARRRLAADPAGPGAAVRLARMAVGDGGAGRETQADGQMGSGPVGSGPVGGASPDGMKPPGPRSPHRPGRTGVPRNRTGGTANARPGGSGRSGRIGRPADRRENVRCSRDKMRPCFSPLSFPDART